VSLFLHRSGKVALGKVNFDAKTEYEYVANYKVLQNVFDAQQITKHVDVARLVKGKFQDNLEMLQWMKHFFDTHYGGQAYDARARREEAKAQYKKGHKHAGTGIKKPAGDDAPAPKAAAAPRVAAAAAAAPKAAVRPAASKAAAPKAAAKPKAAAADSGDAAELTSQLSKLTVTIEGLEKERNFYCL
jgi:RP/EB family microtubule-associated protein